MMGYGWNGGGGEHWVAMGVLMMIFWVAVSAGVVSFVHYSRQQRHDVPTPNTNQSQADRLLDERFAPGDIDADEYTHRHDLLHR